MANPSKQKGTKGETQVVRYLAACGLDAERRALHGSKDVGDVLVTKKDSPMAMVIEVKSGKQTENPNRTQLEDWWQQTLVEGENAGYPSALVINRYRRNIEDCDVFFLFEGMRCHKYLDEFARWVKEVILVEAS